MNSSYLISHYATDMDPEFAGGELEIRNFDREDSGRRSER
jgi:hypothetical protein